MDSLPWEADVIGALSTFIAEGWVAVDVGGHVGAFTTALARMVGPSGRVVVFEAHPDNARVIRQRVAASGLQGRVEIVGAAVTDGAASTVSLYEGRNGSSAEWNVLGIDVEGRHGLSRLVVPAISLDTYFGMERRIDFIKLDVEGAEHLALRGMVGVLARQRPILLIEFHPQTDYRECEGILRVAGYNVTMLDGTPVNFHPEVPIFHALARPGSWQS